MAEILQSRHDFYVLVGTAAATLIGLLFIGFTVNPAIFREGSYEDIRALANETFFTFFYVLAIALIFLIPYRETNLLSVALLIEGGLGLITSSRQFYRAYRKRSAFMSSRLLRRFVWATLAFVLLISIGLALLLGNVYGLFWMVAAIMALLLSATQSTWDLLVKIPEIQQSIQSKTPPSP